MRRGRAASIRCTHTHTHIYSHVPAAPGPPHPAAAPHTPRRRLCLALLGRAGRPAPPRQVCTHPSLSGTHTHTPLHQITFTSTARQKAHLHGINWEHYAMFHDPCNCSGGHMYPHVHGRQALIFVELHLLLLYTSICRTYNLLLRFVSGYAKRKSGTRTANLSLLTATGRLTI